MTEEILLKPADSEDDAKYTFKPLCKDRYERGELGNLSEIQKPKVVDIFGLLRNDQILFEFSDSRKAWREGYLFGISSDGKFIAGWKTQRGLHSSDHYKHIRFQTDRWYFHDGKSECPLPDGVDFELKVVDRFKNSNSIFSCVAQFYECLDINNLFLHQEDKQKVIAYRITGLLDGWQMPGGE